MATQLKAVPDVDINTSIDSAHFALVTLQTAIQQEIGVVAGVRVLLDEQGSLNVIMLFDTSEDRDMAKRDLMLNRVKGYRFGKLRFGMENGTTGRRTIIAEVAAA